jgi:hypothetical protein
MKPQITQISRIFLMKSFCGGGQGGQFFQKAPPLAAGGKNESF